ncbi:hypothetical protein L2E82_49041 [Cichorium intybus]|uniref:Uncharacterized protein n=1 Tax=Cichorium intybus TaxID=13427 RepID=A0ACB8YZC9_CICIN|nr:hypothetical protein L2E82_49041 [Cichorium intybus]
MKILIADKISQGFLMSRLTETARSILINNELGSFTIIRVDLNTIILNDEVISIRIKIIRTRMGRSTRMGQGDRSRGNIRDIRGTSL